MTDPAASPTTPSLADTARGLIAALPASVEMPAGTGKTELLAETTRVLIAEHAARVLLLTHTHAGVQAIRQRLARMNVVRGCTVATISSFAYGFARPYPDLAGMALPAVAVAEDSSLYVHAATRAAGQHHLQRVLAASYTHILVDEYQDCSRSQHALVCVLAEAVPRTAVFGDRMQAIFGFDEALVPWPEVQERFREHAVPIWPWRWHKHNQALGEWLLQLRKQLSPGTMIDLSSGLPPEVTFTTVTDPRWRAAAIRSASRHAWPKDESVLFLGGATHQQARTLAANTDGRFTTMEDVGGAFMLDRLGALTEADPSQYAAWLGELFKICFCNNQKVKLDWVRKLARGASVAHHRAPGVEPVLAALDAVLADPTLASVAAAMDRIRTAPEPRLHSHEAWFEIQSAVRGAATRSDPTTLTDELRKSRDRARHTGRRDRRRMVSRALLVKGLEFDHVVIADVNTISDQWMFYVSMSRARKSITVLGSSPCFVLRETALTPKPTRRRSSVDR